MRDAGVVLLQRVIPDSIKIQVAKAVKIVAVLVPFAWPEFIQNLLNSLAIPLQSAKSWYISFFCTLPVVKLPSFGH